MIVSVTWTHWPKAEPCFRALEHLDSSDLILAEKCTKHDNALMRRNCKQRGMEYREQYLVVVSY